MGVFVESGDFRSPKMTGEDRGYFTVQCADVPLGGRRRKNRRGVKKLGRKKARLTPINENDERLVERQESFTSSDHSNESYTPDSGHCYGFDQRNHGRLSDRSDTPVKKFAIPSLYLQENCLEKELGHITEDGDAGSPDTEVLHCLEDLPPRPSCKRRVLPPSVTGEEVPEQSPRKNRLLKLRVHPQPRKPHVDSVSQTNDLKISKDLQRVMANQTQRVLSERSRPKSAENKVKVIRLSDLKSTDSGSVPDLPSIMKAIDRHSDVKSSSPLTTQSARAAEDYEDSGALSTPRSSRETPSLRGTDLTSFYNMWGKKEKRRPFDRKELDKERGILYNRSCLCSMKHCMKTNCKNQRHDLLPPIGWDQKETC